MSQIQGSSYILQHTLFLFPIDLIQMQMPDGQIVYVLPPNLIQTSHPTSPHVAALSPTPCVSTSRSDEPAATNHSNVSALFPCSSGKMTSLNSLSSSIVPLNTPDSRSEPIQFPSGASPSTPTAAVNWGATHSTEEQLLEELEADISTKRYMIEKYEKLAEDANAASIEMRKAKLKKEEEELKQREQKAKNKLARAIKVMEENEDIAPVILPPTPQSNAEQTPRTGLFKKYIFRNKI